MTPAARVLIFVLAVAGLGIATYFTGVTYRLIPADLAIIPRVCRLREDSCRRIVDTPQARVFFGVPNSLLGMLYYLALILLAAVGAVPLWLTTAFLAVAWGTVVLGAFLTWSLLFAIRVPCALCFASHALNLAIALILSWTL